MSDFNNVITALTPYKKLFTKISIEDIRFRIFSKVTVVCFFFFAGLVTLNKLVGKNIECIIPEADLRKEAVNQYCYVMSTYTVPSLYNKSIGVDKKAAHFGVGPNAPDEEQLYHTYYQWVPFALFLQALSFMIPHLIWKAKDGRLMRSYCELEIAPGVQIKTRALLSKTQNENKEVKINHAAVYFVANMSHNKFYALVYMICEILNLVMVLLNFYFTNGFIGNNYFKNYGPDAVSYSPTAIEDDPESDFLNPSPMDRAFPKVTKCDFQKYGPSGNIIRYDILCVLAVNILNEKIYLFLWFWFIILFIIGGFAIIYRIVKILFPGIRNKLIERRASPDYRSELRDVLSQTKYSDWFVLELISDNIDTIRFGELCVSIREVLRQKHPDERLSTSPPPSYNANEKDNLDHESSLLDA